VADGHANSHYSTVAGYSRHIELDGFHVNLPIPGAVTPRSS
jgi:hypothetical protein